MLFSYGKWRAFEFFQEMVDFSFPKMSAFSHIAQKRVKPVLAYSVDIVELIEPQEAVVLMIF